MNGDNTTSSSNDEESSCFFCGASGPELAQCLDCSDVFYCSESHRSLHRPRETCLPFKVVRDHPLKGRILVAARDIQPFELTVEDLSAAYGPYESNPTTVCVVCLRITQEEEELKCQKCQLPLCQDCVQLDPSNSQRSIHEPECALFSQAKSTERKIFAEYCGTILPIRMIAIRDKDPGFWDRILALESHTKARIDRIEADSLVRCQELLKV